MLAFMPFYNCSFLFYVVTMLCSWLGFRQKKHLGRDHFLAKNALFGHHKRGWKLSGGLNNNILWFHDYKRLKLWLLGCWRSACTFTTITFTS